MTHAEAIETYTSQRDALLQAMQPILTSFQHRSALQLADNHEYDRVTRLLLQRVRYMDRQFSKCTRNSYLQIRWYRPWSLPQFFRMFRKNRAILENTEKVCEQWVELASAMKAEIRDI